MPNSWVALGGSLPSRTWLPSRWWWVFSWAELLVLLLWPPGHICLRLPVSLESSSLWGPASASQCSWSWPQHRRKGSIRGRVELRPRVLVNGRHVTMVWHLWDYIWEDFQLTFWGPVGSVSAVLQWGVGASLSCISWSILLISCVMDTKRGICLSLWTRQPCDLSRSCSPTEYDDTRQDFMLCVLGS